MEPTAREKMVAKVAHAIIANQVALNINEDLKHTPFYKHSLKKHINLLLPDLIKNEADFDKFFDQQETATVQVYDIYERFIKAVSGVPIWDCENITAMIEAYNKDKYTLEPVVNQILNG